jgi:tRNA dimethylallyltransferase
LKQLDPEYVSKADLKNKQRVIRALEVSRFTGKPFSSWHQEEHKERAFRLIKIGLERPREELYSRINTRTARMLDEGLLEEVKSVAAYRHKNALQTVGYKEVFDYFDGSITFDEMQELIKRNSRRYAKRQLTWFKNQDDFNWFHPDEFDSVVDFIKK